MNQDAFREVGSAGSVQAQVCDRVKKGLTSCLISKIPALMWLFCVRTPLLCAENFTDHVVQHEPIDKKSFVHYAGGVEATRVKRAIGFYVLCKQKGMPCLMM